MDQVHRRLRQGEWARTHSPRAHRKDADRLKRAKVRRDERLAEEPPKKKEVIRAPITTSRAERLLFELGLYTPIIAGVVAAIYNYRDPSPPPELKGFAVRTIILGAFPLCYGLNISDWRADRAVTSLRRLAKRLSQLTA